MSMSHLSDFFLELNKNELLYGVEFFEKECFDKLRKESSIVIVLSVLLPRMKILFKTGMYFIIRLNSILKSSFFFFTANAYDNYS